MFKKVVTSRKYWLSVLYLGIAFIVVFSLIEHVSQFRGVSLSGFVETKLANGRWMRFFLSRIVGGVAYGMIMSYYFTARKIKSNK
ncbi:hypothetical protein ACFSTE_11670 [Aquimarina hainanensis]|uniref:Uncharacterized protein n=1 Tax=Aquimarina hainanensis TaxID=1578017 RepID=A0ABW5N7A0_9FLAO